MAKPAAPNTGPDKSPSASRRRMMIGAAFAALIGVAWVIGARHLTLAELHSRLADIQLYAGQHPWRAAAIFLAVHVLVTATSLPFATALTLLAGAIFGRLMATGLVSVGSTAGAVGAMLLSRFFIRDWVSQKFGDRIEPIQQRINTEGRYYLFALRLTPMVPFFLINLAIGPTRMSVLNFAWVSFLGMLPATWIYANAGTALGSVDSPADLLTPGVLIALTLLGLSPLLFRALLKINRRKLLMGAAVSVGVGCVLTLVVGWFRYRTADAMDLAIREFSNAENVADPYGRSLHYGKYNGRSLRLLKKQDPGCFDFEIVPRDITRTPHLARVIIRDVDMRLMIPNPPEWTKDKPALQRIALTDRQWSRQQVRFGGAGSKQVEVTGGDGFEAQRLYSAELSSCGLEAGRCELLLFSQENGDKTLYYQGWFSFPLGHYWKMFEDQTGLSYLWNIPVLERLSEPTGASLKLDDLRTVSREVEAACSFDPEERILAAGEQRRRRRLIAGDNLLAWKDIFDGRSIRFASLVSPGRYTFDRLQGNEYDRMNRFERALIRDIKSPADDEVRNEIELVFSSTHHPGKCRFLVSGFRWHRLPAARVEEYPRGLYMPMGIAVPPYFQDYQSLAGYPPEQSPYFSMVVDEDGRWQSHRQIGLGGPILHRDVSDPDRVHLYLMSSERHTLIGHWVIDRRQPMTARSSSGGFIR